MALAGAVGGSSIAATEAEGGTSGSGATTEVTGTVVATAAADVTGGGAAVIWGLERPPRLTSTRTKPAIPRAAMPATIQGM